MSSVPPLLKHQRDGLRFLRRRNGFGALFMEPGLGKSRIALEYAMETMAKTVIFAPARACELVWPEQAELWAGSLTYGIATGSMSPAKREKLIYDENPDLLFINYELAFWFYERMRDRRCNPYDALVLDESTRIKSNSSVSFRALKACRDAFDACCVMTGTPAPQSLHDLWAQLWMVDKGVALGQKITHFHVKYCAELVYENYRRWTVIEPEALLRDIEGLCIVRRAKDCLDMPSLITRELLVELSAQSRRVYQRAAKERIVSLPDEPDEHALANAGVALSKCRQIASGFFYVTEDLHGQAVTRPVRLRSHEKLDALIDLIEERNGSPLLVVYCYDEEVAMLKEKYPELVIYNSSTTRDVIQRWRDGQIPVLAGQAQAVSLSVNMQSPDAGVCFFSMPWSFLDYLQSIMRVWRQGQKSNVVVYKLIAKDTVDEYVNLVLQQRASIDETLKTEILNQESRR